MPPVSRGHADQFGSWSRAGAAPGFSPVLGLRGPLTLAAHNNNKKPQKQLRSERSSSAGCRPQRGRRRPAGVRWRLSAAPTCSRRETDFKEEKGLTASILLPRTDPRWPTCLCLSGRMRGGWGRGGGCPTTSAPPSVFMDVVEARSTRFSRFMSLP